MIRHPIPIHRLDPTRKRQIIRNQIQMPVIHLHPIRPKHTHNLLHNRRSRRFNLHNNISYPHFFINRLDVIGGHRVLIHKRQALHRLEVDAVGLDVEFVVFAGEDDGAVDASDLA
jgi:hypothetical protein